MKVRFLLILFAPAFFIADGAYAADACSSLLCMAGKLKGQGGGGDCDQPIADYFNILEYGKHGKFSPSKTATSRLSFLNSCSAPGIGDLPNQINAAYGATQI